mmetsp:Transcript_10080/g.23116  ORF Transcript_10080/g.23116 Transcript_10080/m.23116 type:complete len:89 (+) Transcript_10080:1090-1356(+)
MEIDNLFAVSPVHLGRSTQQAAYCTGRLDEATQGLFRTGLFRVNSGLLRGAVLLAIAPHPLRWSPAAAAKLKILVRDTRNRTASVVSA